MAALAAAAMGAFAFIPNVAVAQGNGNKATDPVIPVGSLTAFPIIVQPGTHPKLTWAIDYPSVVKDVVDVDDDTVTTKQPLCVEIRVLGAGVTAGSGNKYKFVPTEAQVSSAGGTYQRVFYDTNDGVKPNKIVYYKELAQGEALRFGGRYYYNGSWGPYFNSQSGTDNIRTLVNGDIPPTTNPMHTAPTLESFIKPYLDASGRVKIGPMDVIVFMELTHDDSQKSNQGYDLQDMVLLATFGCKNNNGHGNNVDGVDSSNPGNAPFEDSDPTVDDENK